MRWNRWYRELSLLDRELENHYLFPEDLALARIPDAQGLGSSRHMNKVDQEHVK